MKGLIFDIQRFSVHDGPGIRTTVFLKGCSLRCFWCHNPEGIRPRPEIQFFPDRCIACGECVAVCPNGAHELRDGFHIYHRDRCESCGLCAGVCYSEALTLIGRTMTVDEVVVEVLRDRAFYDTSGGVTLSGGDPLMQPDFSRAILERCKAEGVHTAIETAANCHWEDLAALLPVTDLVMMDIKHMDPEKHRWATGVSNKRILANARRLAQTDKPVLFRVPVVPTVNDTPEEIGAIARFVQQLIGLRAGDGVSGSKGAIELELLPFHRMAASKYQSLGLKYRAASFVAPDKEKMEELAAIVRSYGVPVHYR
ncbi:MAG: glycyl-radical enzyme activating protein [Anaerolineae bacterium]|nr:glycyl-radical enzyme activating protein [Anaerolineae bacterium]